LLETVNDPPAANVPPVARLPDIRFPVVNDTVPSWPESGLEPTPPRPFRVDALRLNVLEALVIVPP
jgi:hypothetical protein